MDGSYADWCLFERERLQNRYFILLVRLMECCELHQAYEAGLDYGQRVLRINPAHERTHQQMMRLYSLAGFRSMALRQYQNCGQALRDELGVKPSRQTQALFEQIRDDHFEGAQMRYPVHEISLKPAGGNAPETALRQHLEQLCRSLEEIQHKVHNEIQEIRKLLK
jgi:DNA-binding SARP family transcriptional activator